ncbi:MAG: hypothetical protein ACLVH8_11355 [Fusobacterium sp.]
MANEDKLIESKLKYFIYLSLFTGFMYFLSIERDMWFYFFGAIYLVFVFYPIWYWIDNKITKASTSHYNPTYEDVHEKLKKIIAEKDRRKKERKKEEEEENYSYSDPWAEEQKRRNKEYEEYARYEQAKKFNDSFANNRRF